MSDFHPEEIFVAPFPLDMSPEPIQHYFNSNYGETSSVSLYAQESHNYAIVRFVEPASAQKASSAGQHLIAGKKVHIISPIPSRIRSPPSLLDLNDDCLREILERLNLMELSSVAKVCERLKEVAKVVVSAKKEPFELVVQNAQELEGFICDLGPSIRSLFLRRTENEFDERPELGCSILEVLVRYCRDSLVELKMHGFSFRWCDRFLDESPSLFTGVRKMSFQDCYLSIKWILKSRNVVELELIESMLDFVVGDMNCPKLESLKFESHFIHHAFYKALLRFVRQNNQLRTFSTIDYNQNLRTSDFVPPSIESLTISSPIVAKLSRFHNLKKLRLIRTIVSPFDLRPVCDRNINSLEHFEIDETEEYLEMNGQNADAISRLRKLKTMIISVRTCQSVHFQHMVEGLNELEHLRIGTLKNPFSESDLLHIIRNKPNLQFVYLAFHYNGNESTHKNRLRMNAETYRKMLDLILQRSNGKPLHIIIIGPQDEISQIDVTFGMHSALKITCLSTAMAQIYGDGWPPLAVDDYFEITEDGLNQLRAQ